MPEPHDPRSTLDHSSAVGDSSTVDHLVSTDGTHPTGDEPNSALPEIPGYRVLREIARGGMGRVLAAHDLTLDREVALKTLLPGSNADRFIRESKIAARLPHPNIPPVHALGTLPDGSPFLAMKLIAGQTLLAEMKKADRSRLLQVFAQVCQAIGFAHSRGVIHRDLKPANVMVGLFGEVQVMDWGLAKDLASGEREQWQEEKTPIAHAPGSADDADRTSVGQIMGTPAYMAPEQARAEAVDARTDVFALGGILSAILTGKSPFGGQSPAEMILRAAQADLSETHARLDACGADAELVALSKCCLSSNPADRPPNGQAVADELTAYLNGVQERLRSAEIAAAEAAERAKAERRTRRIQLIAASLVLLVLAGGVVGTAIGLVKAKKAQEQAQFAEGEEKKRADELQKVSSFQSKMLQQVNATEAGINLTADLRARHAAALEKSKLPESEKAARVAAFEKELVLVNGTDAAVAMLDRTVLAPSVKTINTQFADQPLVDASLRATLGSIYETLGRYQESLALYQRSYDERLAGLGADHVETLKAQSGVGGALGTLQQLPEAEAAVRTALKGYQRVLGYDHKDTLSTQDLLAQQMHHQGKYDDAVAITRDILERRRRTQGNEHSDTINTMSELGRFLIKSGKYVEAEKVLREVVDIQRRTADPELAASLEYLGNVLVRQKEYIAAEPYFREALESKRKAVGEDHPNTLDAINLLTSALVFQEKLTEAEPLARGLLEKSRRVRGNEHASTLTALNILGQVLFRQNKYAETEKYYREAMETGRRVLGENHPDTIIWIANYGSLLQRLGRLDEAIPYFREALEKNRKKLGETHPYTINILRNLADIMRQQNKSAEAESYLRPLLEAVRLKEGEDHSETIGLLGILGATLRDQGKLDEAETYLQKCLDGNRKRYGDDHANTLTAVLRMGSLRIAQEKYSEALAVLTPAEGKVTRAIPGMTGVLRNASLISMIGKCRAKMAKDSAEFAAIEARLLECQSTFAKHRGDKDIETRKATQDLIDFYTAWDKADSAKGYDAKAAEWKTKLEAAKR